MWTERAVITAEIKTRAKRALEILFETERKLHNVTQRDKICNVTNFPVINYSNVKSAWPEKSY